GSLFFLIIILPTLFIIILPEDFLQSTYSYLFALAVFLILACLFPIVKRSTRYAPLSLISLLTSYLIIESLIHIGMLEAINPWGIFNNISRQNLIGILKNQEVLQAAGNPPLFLGIDFLGILVPFIDVIILSIAPFTIGVSLAGLLEHFDWSLKKRLIAKVFFVLLFTISIITIPLTYHALGKGSEGTLHASIGLTEAIEIFDPKFMEDLENNYQQLLGLIESARWHLLKSGNSFMQFAENPLMAYLLPYFIPSVSGIPLKDLPGIFNLTVALGNSLTYFPNILWSISNFQDGFDLTLDILQNTISQINGTGAGASITQFYNVTMKTALSIINKGLNNLTYAQDPLLNLISQISSRLNYSIFGEITTFLQELKIALPVLTIVIANFVPWINSTYKLSLALQDLYENSNFHSDLLDDAKEEFNSTRELLSIESEKLPQRSEENFIPIHDLVDFSISLYNISQYYLFSVDNASLMFRELNSTLSIVQSLDLSNSSNIKDPRWATINEGLHNTGIFLNHTENSLIEMQNIINSQQSTQLEFEQLDQLNTFFNGLGDFVQSTRDRFSVINTYYLAFNSTYYSIYSFSKGSYSLNQTIDLALNNQTFDSNFTQASQNFTNAQIEANLTYDLLEGISDHLLNESSITSWQDIVRGDITNNETNSIYVNAESCLTLIEVLKISAGLNEDLTPYLSTFDGILVKMEAIDW
ncbi:MAG: hypothetical protein ACTSR2_14425, partial [Candidatus Hodarchaeales archaeon]